MPDRRRNLFVLLLVLGLIAASAVAVAAKPTRLGLDLQGGVQLIYQGKPTPQQPQVTQEALDRAVQIIRERVDALGVAEPEIQRSGRDQIVIGLPSIRNAERAERQVGNTAQLFFYDWEPNVLGPDCKPDPTDASVTEAPAGTLYEAAKRASKCPGERDDDNTARDRFYLFGANQELVAGPEENREDLFSELPGERAPEGSEVFRVPEGVVLVQVEKPENAPEGTEVDQWYVVRDDPELTGTDIKNPEQNFDQQAGGQPVVTMEFTSDGRRKFQEVTRRIAQRGQEQALPGVDPRAANQHFAIVLDDELVSRPFIDFRENPDGIDGSTGAQISGGFTIQSAQDLANFLKIGALPIKLELISRSQVSATLGREALDQGVVAGLAGFAIVALFLLTFYRVLGVVATLALGVYALYFYALIELIPVTLTLPGVAGLILTLGVAADANIVVFERVKEEIRAGRSIGAGIVQGYRKGFSTILDANVVTLLVAFILFVLATAGVKGFALTLGLGTIVSLFTAVLATQAILLSLRGSRVLQRRSALGAGEQRHSMRFNYMGASKWFFSASGVILLLGALAVAGKGLNFGIDFESGTRITTSLERPASVEDVRGAMARVGQEDAEIQGVEDSDLGANAYQISAGVAPQGVSQVRDALDEEFGVRDFSQQSIGPTFGETVANSALIAIIASLLVIAMYIGLRFEWKYAVPVLIALMHDILITSGIYALTEREVTTSTVAALLTILGFSLYDTIIVFDRVRENVPRMPRAAFSQIVNRSMSEVIVRSLATSFCTVLPVLGLFFFGGETLKDFAFALIVGTISGTYSSVFIAAPVLTHWKEREPVYRARERRILAEFGGVIPAYAAATAGAPADAEPTQPRAGRRRRIAEPDQRDVSREDFDDMVRNLGLEEQRPAARTSTRPPRPPRPAPPAADGPSGGDGPPRPDAGPGKAPKPKKSRNRRHGRAR